MCPSKTFKKTESRTQLIWSHLSTGFCFELSGNSNYSTQLLFYPLIFDDVMRRSQRKLLIKYKIQINHVRPVIQEVKDLWHIWDDPCLHFGLFLCQLWPLSLIGWQRRRPRGRLREGREGERWSRAIAIAHLQFLWNSDVLMTKGFYIFFKHVHLGIIGIVHLVFSVH